MYKEKKEKMLQLADLE
jgi:hypothetical protein